MRMVIQGYKRKKSAQKGTQNGYILFSLLLIGTLIICIAMSASIGLKSTLRTAGITRVHGNAFNIAEAGKEHALAKLRLDSVNLQPNNDIAIFNDYSFDMGSYTVRCLSNAAMDTLTVRSSSIAGNQTTTVEALCYRFTTSSSVSFSFPSAVVAKSDVATLGNITIDGNDWDSTDDSIIGNGVYGISTCGTYSNGGSSEVYGRGYVSGSCGKKGASCPIDSIVKSGADTSGYPRTPEQVLGLPPGSLDKIKTSSFPSTPFHGIVYVTGPGTINTPDFNGSTGIFIYHDSTFQSILKNIHGSFKGILISDQIDHVNGSTAILGAVVTLSNDPAGNCFGNGNATIHYSSRVLSNMGQYMGKPLVVVDVISWKEL